jgi:hypothetical protein
MRIGILCLTCCCMFAAVSCEKKPTSTDFKNELTLGTGSSGFALTGTGTVFDFPQGGSLQLYWRLESSDDMAGSRVIISIENFAGGVSVSQTYTNSQSYGHIMCSSITITAAGSYRATGTLETGNKQIAAIDFAVQ